MSSEAATADPSPAASEHEPEAAAPAVLGSGMAHRSRSQSVLAQHWSPSGLIGAVGRASVGFGLAVGRSRAIRPTVRFDDVNSAALRPSPELWRMRRGNWDPGADGPGDHIAGVDRPIGALSARPAVASVTGQRSLSGVPTPASRVDHRQTRPRADRVGRPTWTDQIIQRSSIGFVAPAPGGPMPEPAVPADFVPSGDAKLDRLRLLVREREQGTPAPSHRNEPAVRRTTAANPTVSASRDAAVPGQLARAMRPESALAAAVPQARVGGGAALPGGSGPTDAPGRPAVRGPEARTDRRSPDGPARRRGAQRPAEPSKLDRLRSMLVEQGILPAEPTEGSSSTEPSASIERTTSIEEHRDGAARRAIDGSSPPPAEPRVPATSTESTAVRTTTTSNELRRTVSDDVRGRGDVPTSVAPGSSPDGGSSALGDRATTRTTTNTELRRTASDDVRSRGDVPTSVVPGSSPDGGSSSLGDRATTPTTVTPSPAAPTAATRTATAPTTVTPDVPRITVSPLARQLRAQRLLRSGLVGEADGMPNVADRTASGAPAPVLSPSSSVAVPTSSSIDVVEPATGLATRPVVARSMRSPWQIDRPNLVRTDSPAATTVVRRVTLPRALSSRHRPVTPLSRDIARSHPSATLTVQRASVTTLAESLASSPMIEPGSSVAPWVSSGSQHGGFVGTGERRATSLVPAGTGALLDVVRRTPRPAGVTDVAVDPTIGDRVSRRSSDPRGADPDRSVRPSLRRDDLASVGSVIDGSPTTSTPATDRSSVGTSGEVVAPPGRAVERARSSEPTGVVRRTANDGSDTGHGTAEAGQVVAGVAATASVDPIPPAERVAEQFMTTLSETVRRRPAPLPSTFRPMADAIAGPRPVMLSTDAASRRALRSVGKVAATTGDTIHLDHQSIPSVRLAEVMAHELTHIAHPSPAPRFFDDIDDSPEERRAEQVARVMARSPLAPSATTSAPPVRRDQHTVRRSPATQPTAAPATSPGAVSAQALAASLTATGNSSGVVQRWAKATPSAQRPQIGSQRPQIGSHRQAPAPDQTSASERESEPGDVFGSVRSVEWFRDQLGENLDRLVRLLEDRMIVELERRGGRAWRQS